jgi:hypothetical protein
MERTASEAPFSATPPELDRSRAPAAAEEEAEEGGGDQCGADGAPAAEVEAVAEAVAVAVAVAVAGA